MKIPQPKMIAISEQDPLLCYMLALSPPLMTAPHETGVQGIPLY